MRAIIETTELYTFYYHGGMTRFSGCQCYKDCSCGEDFVSESYEYYSVVKKFNKPKTTHHSTEKEARERIDFLDTLPVNYINHTYTI